MGRLSGRAKKSTWSTGSKVKSSEQNESSDIDKDDKEQIKLLSAIQKLSNEEVPNANRLISTMRYPKGPNKGKIYSPYNTAHF
jgi:hypothetical protein